MNAHSGLWVLNRNRLGEFHYTVEHKKDPLAPQYIGHFAAYVEMCKNTPKTGYSGLKCITKILAIKLYST